MTSTLCWLVKEWNSPTRPTNSSNSYYLMKCFSYVKCKSKQKSVWQLIKNTKCAHFFPHGFLNAMIGLKFSYIGHTCSKSIPLRESERFRFPKRMFISRSQVITSKQIKLNCTRVGQWRKKVMFYIIFTSSNKTCLRPF